MDNQIKLVTKFLKLKREAKLKGISDDQVYKIFKEEKDLNQNEQKPKVDERIKKRNLRLIFLGGILPIIFGVLFMFYNQKEDFIHSITEARCAVDNSGMFIEVARPLTNCEMCRNLHQVPNEYEISVEDFSKKYAYTAVPVLIKDATKNWTAMNTFSYDFLKELYVNTTDAFEVTEEECQFFPYKTDFETLEDAFNMTDDRAHFKEGEKTWYFGWSNCHPDISTILRKHYNRPYFLPNDSESSSLDWIFMGGSGLGAFVHLDYVQRPSWQAQISGKKTWTLVPTPECEDICHSMNVTVHKGDIFVVDTNQWYHSTFIHPGEVSITIGSEYD
ncbi:uncharacterized protein LOC134724622 [Mytilus trossulus]|uniref:uncharacterized protein LOC134724622 n=1 Tax=Mytilus trossulus TaxID=6551 RepID=UPI0030050634